MRAFNALNMVRALKRKFAFHLWMDRLAFRGDGRNIDDCMLKDIGLAHRDRPGPTDPFFFI
jgi:hypothetical protein